MVDFYKINYGHDLTSRTFNPTVCLKRINVYEAWKLELIFLILLVIKCCLLIFISPSLCTSDTFQLFIFFSLWKINVPLFFLGLLSIYMSWHTSVSFPRKFNENVISWQSIYSSNNFNYIYGHLGDEDTPSECEETHTLLNSGLFLNLQF